ncbi:MAG TPA: tetratricopeptide repeat protein [Blastocatellia bacterium]|nr:tetratricopeptide repeat protein [Blastocatellia bacterium]
MKQIEYKFGPFTLSPSERRLRRGRREVDIDSTQFDLLLFLVENAGQVVSKDAMIAKVWDGQIVEESTIFMAVCRLRRTLKTGAQKETVYVRTAPKKGYCFVCPVKESSVEAEPTEAKESLHLAHFNPPPSPPVNISRQLEHLTVVIGLLGAQISTVATLLQESLASSRDTRFTMDSLNEQMSADFFFDLAEAAGQRLVGAEQNTWFDRLEAEHENLCAALDYYGKTDSTATRELELAILLGRFWDTHGYWSLGREVLERALARQHPGSPDLRAKGLAWLGFLAYCQSDYTNATKSLTESIKITREIGDQECLAFALHSLGWVAEGQGQYQEARGLFTESLNAAQKAKADLIIGQAYRGLGSVVGSEGDHLSAKNYYLKSLRKREELQDLRGYGATLNNLGTVALAQGNFAEAHTMHERSLSLSQGGGNRCEVSNCYFNLGVVEEAAGQFQAAGRYFEKSLSLRQEIGDRRGVAKAMEAIGKMREAVGKTKDAARIFGAADALRSSIAAPLSPAEQGQYGHVLTSIKKKFPSDWKEGGQQSVNDVIA